MMHRNTRKGLTEEIGTCERYVLGEKTTYRLLLDKMDEQIGYRIEIARGKDSAQSLLGEDFLSVAVLFAEIVRGEVFPYSLEEIAEDFRKNAKIYRDKNA